MTRIKCPYCEGAGKMELHPTPERVLAKVTARMWISASDISKATELRSDAVGHALLDLWIGALVERKGEQGSYLYRRSKLK